MRELSNEWFNVKIMGEDIKGKHTTMTAIFHNLDYGGHTVRFDMKDKEGNHLEYVEMPARLAIQQIMGQRAMKKLLIRIPIRPTSKMYRRCGNRIFKAPATARFEERVRLYTSRQISRFRWKSGKNLKIVFLFYFATKAKGKWDKKKTTKPDIDNLVKSALDGVSKIVGDDAKVAEIEAKKFFAEKDMTIIEIINQNGEE